MNEHYQQFVSCFLENLFLAKTSKLEITAVAVSSTDRSKQKVSKKRKRVLLNATQIGVDVLAVVSNYDVFISVTYV